MTIIHINHFMGMAPRYGDRKLHPNQAQLALNVDLWSRELRSIQSNLQVNNPTKSGTIQTIYPLNNKWLHWTTDVNVVPAPLQTEQDGRIYYTGDFNPKSSNNSLATVGAGTNYPLAFYRLGLPQPEAAPSVGVTGGTGPAVARSYVYTFVTAWGEEGPPSAPTSYTGNQDGTWNITGMNTAPLNSGNITNAVHSAGVVTITLSAPCFLETGDYCVFASTGGMTDLNGTRKITRIDSTHISVVLTTAQTYTSGGTWTREAPIQTASMTLNLYRTVSGVYKLVASGITASNYNDTVSDANLGEELPSATWYSPDGDLKGLISLPNGSFAGFVDNVLAFSEPYYPHAWPSDYQITFPYLIVAIHAIGNSIFVATTSHPYVVTGYHPESMSDRKIQFNQACVSKQSMTSVMNGVVYATAIGLAYIPEAGAPDLITRRWFKRNDWQLYNPSSMKAYTHDDRVYLFYKNGGEDQNENGVIIFDPSENESTVTLGGENVTGGYTDIDEDEMYLIEGTAITQYGAGGSYQTFSWKSKKYTTARPVAFKAAKVKITYGAGISESERQAALDSAIASVDADIANGNILTTGAFAGSPPATYTVAGGPYFNAIKGLSEAQASATLRVYGDGILYAEKTLADSMSFRLPVIKNKLCDTWEVEVSGYNVDVHEVLISETMSELREV